VACAWWRGVVLSHDLPHTAAPFLAGVDWATLTHVVDAPHEGVGSLDKNMSKYEWNRGIWQKVTGSGGVQWRTLFEGHYKHGFALKTFAVCVVKRVSRVQAPDWGNHVGDLSTAFVHAPQKLRDEALAQKYIAEKVKLDKKRKAQDMAGTYSCRLVLGRGNLLWPLTGVCLCIVLLTQSHRVLPAVLLAAVARSPALARAAQCPTPRRVLQVSCVNAGKFACVSSCSACRQLQAHFGTRHAGRQTGRRNVA
jgi:hypothetical protein